MKPRFVMAESVSAWLKRGRPTTAAAEVQAAAISMRRLVRSELIFEGMLISY
jgi:hypothetical protein